MVQQVSEDYIAGLQKACQIIDTTIEQKKEPIGIFHPQAPDLREQVFALDEVIHFILNEIDRIQLNQTTENNEEGD